MNHLLRLVFTGAILASAFALAQGRPPHINKFRPESEMPPPMSRRPPMERALHVGPPGRWWRDPAMAKDLGLSADQQKKMDDIFQESRLKLIDLDASLQKEEQVLEPLVSDEQPDESKILGQIDRVAQARAELEKANARMLLGIRKVLTPDQWKKLQEEGPGPPHGPGEFMPHPGPEHGGLEPPPEMDHPAEGP